MSFNYQKSKTKLILLILLIPLGFLTKLYTGPAHSWINNSLGGILYVVFWILLLSFIKPKWNPLHISLLIFLITSSLEFTQLINSPLLNTIRSTFIGRSLIGSTFNPMDFLYYLIGTILGYFLTSLPKKTIP